MREYYHNGDPIDLKHNGCDGCSPSTINGVLVHERGCPDAWRDAVDDLDFHDEAWEEENSDLAYEDA